MAGTLRLPAMVNGIGRVATVGSCDATVFGRRAGLTIAPGTVPDA